MADPYPGRPGTAGHMQGLRLSLLTTPVSLKKLRSERVGVQPSVTLESGQPLLRLHSILPLISSPSRPGKSEDQGPGC